MLKQGEKCGGKITIYARCVKVFPARAAKQSDTKGGSAKFSKIVAAALKCFFSEEKKMVLQQETYLTGLTSIAGTKRWEEKRYCKVFCLRACLASTYFSSVLYRAEKIEYGSEQLEGVISYYAAMRGRTLLELGNFGTWRDLVSVIFDGEFEEF